MVINTFSRNSHDGISITATVSQLFAAILFLSGEWDDDLRHIRPEVRENVFEKIWHQYCPKAAPVLVGNRIIKNRAGIVARQCPTAFARQCD